MMCSTPASRFLLATSKYVAKPSNLVVTNSYVVFPNKPKSIQSVSSEKATAIPKWLMDVITQLEAEAKKLQEEVDNTFHTIQDQNNKIKMLHDEIVVLHEEQGQNTKNMAEIHTSLHSLSSMVTEVVGRLEMINVAPSSVGNVKPIATKLTTTEKKHHGKPFVAGEVTFINERGQYMECK